MENIAAFLSNIPKKGKFLIVFLKLILGKARVDGFTGPRRTIYVRYEFGFKAFLKGLLCK